MKLTRKELKALGLTDEQVDVIAEAHGETTSVLTDKIKALEAKVSDYDAVKKERDDLKASDFREKYEQEHADFEAFKAQTVEKAQKVAKENAARAYFVGKKITGSNLSLALRGAKDEINALELDDDGAIKDTAALDGLISGDYAGLIGTVETKGAATANPPKNDGGGAKLTKKDILSIKDTVERQKAIEENPDLFK